MISGVWKMEVVIHHCKIERNTFPDHLEFIEPFKIVANEVPDPLDPETNFSRLLNTCFVFGCLGPIRVTFLASGRLWVFVSKPWPPNQAALFSWFWGVNKLILSAFFVTIRLSPEYLPNSATYYRIGFQLLIQLWCPTAFTNISPTTFCGFKSFNKMFLYRLFQPKYLRTYYVSPATSVWHVNWCLINDWNRYNRLNHVRVRNELGV